MKYTEKECDCIQCQTHRKLRNAGDRKTVATNPVVAPVSVNSTEGVAELEAALRSIESYMGPKLYCDEAYSEAAKAWEHLQKAVKVERRCSATGADERPVPATQRPQ